MSVKHFRQILTLDTSFPLRIIHVYSSFRSAYEIIAQFYTVHNRNRHTFVIKASDKTEKGKHFANVSQTLSNFSQNSILEDFENASPYFCNFLANRICDCKVTRRF